MLSLRKIRIVRITTVLIVLIFLAPTTSLAMLMTGPEIVSFSVNPTNTYVVSIQVEDAVNEALNFTALSADAGETFSIIEPPELRLAPTNLLADQRRFALGGGFLLRSDDGGLTWTNTGARRFLREQIDAVIEKDRAEHEKETRARVPFRSNLWTPVFICFAVLHSIVVFPTLRSSRGGMVAMANTFQSIALLLIAWLMLTASYHVFHFFNDEQWPGRFWNTSHQFYPGLKTAIIVNIAAKPLPLLAYLIAVSSILPGTLDSVLDRFVNPPIRRRIQLVLFLLAAVLVLLIHIYLSFIGPFTA